VVARSRGGPIRALPQLRGRHSDGPVKDAVAEQMTFLERDAVTAIAGCFLAML
jgi:hypothetical protein